MADADEFSVVHATARVRGSGSTRYTPPAVRRAWRDIAEVARTLAWLADREIGAFEPLAGADADVATRCAALLERASSGRDPERDRRNAHLVVLLLERSDAAVKALGGTVAAGVTS